MLFRSHFSSNGRRDSVGHWEVNKEVDGTVHPVVITPVDHVSGFNSEDFSPFEGMLGGSYETLMRFPEFKVRLEAIKKFTGWRFHIFSEGDSYEDIIRSLRIAFEYCRGTVMGTVEISVDMEAVKFGSTTSKARIVINDTGFNLYMRSE